MNYTKHSLVRYSTRFKGVDKKEAEKDLISNKERYEAELNKMFENAKEIYQGKFNDHNEVKYFLADNIILVVDLPCSKIITLYRIEFGFEREIDKIILISLLEQLNKADEKYIKALDTVQEKMDEIDTQTLSIMEEIKSIEETLQALRSGLEGLEQYKKTITVNEEKARIERDRIAKKVVYSIDYRKSIEEIVND